MLLDEMKLAIEFVFESRMPHGVLRHFKAPLFW